MNLTCESNVHNCPNSNMILLRTLNCATYKLSASLKSMRKARPQPTIGPCSSEGTQYGHGHDGDSIADESEKWAGACASEGPSHPEDRAAYRVLNAAAQRSARDDNGLAVGRIET
jgi:hypothetical protein